MTEQKLLKVLRNCLLKIKIPQQKPGKSALSSFQLAIKRLQLVSGLGNEVCDETLKNLLKMEGYKFLHSTKKRLLKPKDLQDNEVF